MFQRIYMFAAVLLLATAAWGAAAADLAAPTTRGNVTIQLPKGWANPAGPALIAAQAPAADKDTSGSYQASLSITQDAGDKVDGAAQVAAMARQIPGYQVVEAPAQVTINGVQGVRFGGTFKRGTVEVRSRQYMFAVNKQVYTITFTSLKSTWGNYQTLLQASVATFTIKK